MDPREERLPGWAKEIINGLRQRVQHGNEPLLREVAKLRPEVAALRAKNEALTELLQMAAKGGHVAASQIVAVIEEYAPWKDESAS